MNRRGFWLGEGGIWVGCGEGEEIGKDYLISIGAGGEKLVLLEFSFHGCIQLEMVSHNFMVFFQ